ncbi:MAG: hypothetical protein ACR2HN_08200 [Tepidiformaceae bacterium]
MLLRPGDKTWPTLLEAELGRSLGEPVTVDNWRFVPGRPRAAEKALELVAAAQPDVVVLTLASFWSAFATVRASVEQRFGRRAGRIYTRFEGAFSRQAQRRGRPATFADRAGRRLSRRVFGTATFITLS